jgi:hypothetical protein
MEIKMSKRYRDAETGEFITEDYAKKHPKTTISETIKKPAKKSNPTKKSPK